MSYAPDMYAREFGMPVIQASESVRAEFIRKTYANLVGAIGAFIAIESFLFSLHLEEKILQALFSSQISVLVLMVAFVGSGYLAQYWARSATSPAMQYAGLALYVVAESIIFLPILYVAVYYSNPTVLPTAAIVTLCIFGGLTAYVFTTKQDFSFLGPALAIISFGVIGLIICAIAFGFTLGLGFTVAMIMVAAAYVLYDTSNVLHHYPVGMHVAAALELFASVALLFWYVLRLVMALQDRR